jgi:hypothetical protein
MGKAQARRCGHARSGKCHADPPLLAPDDVALLTRIAGRYIQRDFVWDARGASNFERGSRRGYVANGAIDSPAVELDRSGLENTLPLVGSSLLHASGLARKSENRANRNIKISGFKEPPVNHATATPPVNARWPFGMKLRQQIGNLIRIKTQTTGRF